MNFLNPNQTCTIGLLDQFGNQTNDFVNMTLLFLSAQLLDYNFLIIASIYDQKLLIIFN